MSEFFAMGGYAFYVWGSFAITALAIAVELHALRARGAAAREGARLELGNRAEASRPSASSTGDLR